MTVGPEPESAPPHVARRGDTAAPSAALSETKERSSTVDAAQWPVEARRAVQQVLGRRYGYVVSSDLDDVLAALAPHVVVVPRRTLLDLAQQWHDEEQRNPPGDARRDGEQCATRAARPRWGGVVTQQQPDDLVTALAEVVLGTWTDEAEYDGETIARAVLARTDLVLPAADFVPRAEYDRVDREHWAAVAELQALRRAVLDLADEIDKGTIGHIDEYVSGERAIAERLRVLAGDGRP